MTSVEVAYTIPDLHHLWHTDVIDVLWLGTVSREQLLNEPYSKAEFYAGLQNSAGQLEIGWATSHGPRAFMCFACAAVGRAGKAHHG